MKTKAKITGTHEWAPKTVNCQLGCEHDCRYCYARANALRFGLIKTPEEWRQPQVLRCASSRALPRGGVVMFPSTHDITPRNLDLCLCTIDALVCRCDQVLVVTKPHLECVRAICERKHWREKILFRFSIGSMREEVLEYWEPGAPTFGERFECLGLARTLGFGTSVSCEPLLDAGNAVALFRYLEPWVSDTIWIGCMNHIGRRCVGGASPLEIEAIKAGQTPKMVRLIYDLLQDQPKVRWKDSYRKILEI